MLNISALVLTYNEESNIKRCLSSLSFCKEIVIVDSGSADRTLEIAAGFTDKIIHHEMEGFGAQRNLGIDSASNDWILWLDADEEISEELRKNISSIQDNPEIAGYYLNRQTQYLGKWIKHSGWYPQYVLRLFNRKFGRCREVPVHESISLQGKTAYLKGDILHYAYRDLAHHISKINHYTTLIAKQKYEKGKRFNPYKLLFAPPAEFMKKYILKYGFLDGASGFAIAVTSAYYNFLKELKLYELTKTK